MEMLPLGTDGSMDQVIARYQNMVYGIALTRTRCAQDADDVFQEVFLAYYRRGLLFREEEHRKAWLIQTTINCSKKQLRKQRGEVLELTEAAGGFVSLETEEESEVYAALCSLPEKYRTVLYLYYFEDLSVAQIGAFLHLRPGTVRMQMTRGRALLKERLKGEYFDE